MGLCWRGAGRSRALGHQQGTGSRDVCAVAGLLPEGFLSAHFLQRRFQNLCLISLVSANLLMQSIFRH